MIDTCRSKAGFTRRSKRVRPVGASDDYPQWKTERGCCFCRRVAEENYSQGIACGISVGIAPIRRRLGYRETTRRAPWPVLVRLLLDTNVMSKVTKPRPDEGCLKCLQGLHVDRTLISIVSIAEIRRGVALMDSGWRLGRTAHA